MNKSRCLPCLMLVCGAILQSEAQPAGEPVPPLVKNAPVAAAWRVTFTKRQTELPAAASAQPAEIREIDVAKAGGTRHEVIFTGAGLTTDRWFCSGMVLYTNAGNPTIYVNDMRDENTARMFPNYAASDFPELSWVKRSYYAGVQQLGGVVCFYYAEPHADRQVWIDQATGLPVAYRNGGTVQNYAFHPARPGPLEPPAPFLKALKDFKAARSLSRHEAKYN